jgi:hypothetical protein
MMVVQVCNSFELKLQSSCLFYWRSTHFICVTPHQYTIQVNCIHSASNDASEFANSTSQASSPSDDTVDSIWQLSEKDSLYSSESASKLSCDICKNDKMSVDTDCLVSEKLTCSNTSTRKISKEDTKDNGCDGEPPSQCKFQIPIFENFSIYEKFPRSYSYVFIDCDDSEDNGCDVEPLIHGEY